MIRANENEMQRGNIAWPMGMEECNAKNLARFHVTFSETFTGSFVVHGSGICWNVPVVRFLLQIAWARECVCVREIEWLGSDTAVLPCYLTQVARSGWVAW